MDAQRFCLALCPQRIAAIQRLGRNVRAIRPHQSIALFVHTDSSKHTRVIADWLKDRSMQIGFEVNIPFLTIKKNKSYTKSREQLDRTHARNLKARVPDSIHSQLPQPSLELVELLPQSRRQARAELRKMLFNVGQFGFPRLRVHTQQFS